MHWGWYLTRKLRFMYISDDVDMWQLIFNIVDIDDCLPSPCLHGTCKDHLNGYICTCSHGYTGTDCYIGK